MKCPEAIRQLDAYVDDELDSAGALALEEHLRALRGALRRHTELRMAPVGLRARLEEQLGTRGAPDGGRATRRIALAAAALAVLALGISLWGPGRPVAVANGQSKVVYHITSSQTASAALRTLRNHLTAAPDTKVVVVAHNEGVDFLLRGARDESGELFEPAVRGFKTRGVEFRVCNNTLVRRHIGATGLIPEATLVPSGIAEVGRLQEKEGYAYLRM